MNKKPNKFSPEVRERAVLPCAGNNGDALHRGIQKVKEGP